MLRVQLTDQVMHDAVHFKNKHEAKAECQREKPHGSEGPVEVRHVKFLPMPRHEARAHGEAQGGERQDREHEGDDSHKEALFREILKIDSKNVAVS